MAKRRRKLTIEDLGRLRVINQAAMSPDGDRIAVSIKRCDLKKNKNLSSLYLTNARGGRLRRLTTGDHNDTHPKWSPDGTTIAFMSDRDRASCIWLLPMDGGEPVRLTDRDHDVAEFNFSPDGRHIVFTAREKNERDKLRRDEKKKELETTPDFIHIRRLNHKLDGAGFWNGHYVHVYSIRTSGGKAVQLTRGDYDHTSPQFSPDGRRIAFLSNRMPDPDREHFENADIYTMTTTGGGLKKVTPKEGVIVNYSWSPDGGTFAYIGHEGKTGETALYNAHVWTIPARGGRPQNLTSDIDNHCFNITISDIAEITFSADPPVWSADGGVIYFVVSERGAANLYHVAAGGGRATPTLVGDHVVMAMSRAAKRNRAAVVIGTPTNPADVFAIDLDRAPDRPKQVTHVNRAVLAGIKLSDPEPLACRRGGHTVHGWVIKPPEFRNGKKYPLVLEIHGGPYCQYGHAMFHEMQWLAARGYVVVFTNPRGSVGYGLKHLTALHHRWGVPDTPDVLACVDQVVRGGYVDKKRLYITGGSYGGFMTNWVTARDHRFKAGVTQRCVANMDSMLGSDFGWFIAHEVGCMPWDDPKRTRAASPIAYAKDIKTPLLIIHSEQDLRCPIGQGEELFATLKCLGKEVEFVRFAGESHGLSRGGRPQNRAERLRRILDWFERHR
ncbi:MAG: S9 family peptidase [Phycisphaerae bacterium]